MYGTIIIARSSWFWHCWMWAFFGSFACQSIICTAIKLGRGYLKFRILGFRDFPVFLDIQKPAHVGAAAGLQIICQPMPVCLKCKFSQKTKISDREYMGSCVTANVRIFSGTYPLYCVILFKSISEVPCFYKTLFDFLKWISWNNLRGSGGKACLVV